MICEQPPTVSQALSLAQDRDATVKLDSVYGILGLLKSKDAATPTPAWQIPNYDQDFYQMCLQICVHILEETGNLDILSTTEVRRHHETDPAVSTPDKHTVASSTKSAVLITR